MVFVARSIGTARAAGGGKGTQHLSRSPPTHFVGGLVACDDAAETQTALMLMLMVGYVNESTSPSAKAKHGQKVYVPKDEDDSSAANDVDDEEVDSGDDSVASSGEKVHTKNRGTCVSSERTMLIRKMAYFHETERDDRTPSCVR
jgi:hypothetical protein